MRKTQHLARREVGHILASCTPPNRLALEVSLATGLRIGDVLAIKTSKLNPNRKMTITESKTGKRRRITLPVELYERMTHQAGKYYVWANRRDYTRHRTRQAVHKDLRRVAKLMRLKVVLAPHSMRKIYAVEQYHRSGGDLERVKRLLNHSSSTVTMVYAMADELTKRTLVGHVKNSAK